VNSWKIILATVVIFGSGVLTGGLLVNYVERAQPEVRHPAEAHHANANPNPKSGSDELPLPRPQLLNQQFVGQLDATLHLTPEQRAKIQKIIADGQERNRDLWKLVSPQFRSVMQDVRQGIRSTLTPAQKKQFEELMKQLSPRRQAPSTNAPAATLPTNAPSAPVPSNAPPASATNASPDSV
jgi:Spy/CpxP family protein refolding chaperone